MEYNSPSDILIVGNGDYIVYYDKELDQITNIDYEDIPAALILANTVKIDNKELKVSDLYQDTGITKLSLEYTKDDFWAQTMEGYHPPINGSITIPLWHNYRRQTRQQIIWV